MITNTNLILNILNGSVFPLVNFSIFERIFFSNPLFFFHSPYFLMPLIIHIKTNWRCFVVVVVVFVVFFFLFFFLFCFFCLFFSFKNKFY